MKFINKYKYYSAKEILKLNAQYNLVIGERSNGKTYCLLNMALENWVKKRKKTGYIRRWAEDLKGKRETNMKLVIDIDDKVYETLKDNDEMLIVSGVRSGKSIALNMCNAIRTGRPLPKGHGRLIDADAFITTLEAASKRQKYKELLIDNHFLTVDDVFKAVIESLQNEGLSEGDSPTIIEAESEE